MNIKYDVKSFVEYPRMKKRGLKVVYFSNNNNKKRQLTLEVIVDINKPKSEINLLEELAIIICGGMGDFENYKEFNNLENTTIIDKHEYKRQSELLKKIERFFLFEEPDGSKHSYIIDFAKNYFSDFLYDSSDYYFEHSRNLY